MFQFLALLALDLAGLVLLWFLLRARIRRFLEIDNLLSGVRDEARALVMELNETADRNVSLVEDRIVALRSLLDEVDRRMGVARRELESRETEREVFERLRRRRPILPEAGSERPPISLVVPQDEGGASPRGAPPPPAEIDAAPGDRAARGHSPGDVPIPLSLRGARRPEAVPVEPVPRRIPEVGLSPDPIAPARSQREEAMDLYRKGFSADIIAARLGATVAEIELIVEMEERRVEAGAAAGKLDSGG